MGLSDIQFSYFKSELIAFKDSALKKPQKHFCRVNLQRRVKDGKNNCRQYHGSHKELFCLPSSVIDWQKKSFTAGIAAGVEL